jgi:hypothetical protein
MTGRRFQTFILNKHDVSRGKPVSLQKRISGNAVHICVSPRNTCLKGTRYAQLKD